MRSMMLLEKMMVNQWVGKYIIMANEAHFCVHKSMPILYPGQSFTLHLTTISVLPMSQRRLLPISCKVGCR
jgi:hypothetical protein